MSRNLEFDGYWTGEVVYECDCDECQKRFRFPFTSEDEAKNAKEQQAEIRKHGWITTKVNGQWKDFCSEKCRNAYIRKNTI